MTDCHASVLFDFNLHKVSTATKDPNPQKGQYQTRRLRHGGTGKRTLQIKHTKTLNATWTLRFGRVTMLLVTQPANIPAKKEIKQLTIG
ncbi:hypothetical protein VINI7043_09719 [Vibrio nigripulchritudo ATCC 27043]|nr:hypothetical protein VINI7043_09719 [Vibrio nigripulchritudo ATCC 27043]